MNKEPRYEMPRRQMGRWRRLCVLWRFNRILRKTHDPSTLFNHTDDPETLTGLKPAFDPIVISYKPTELSGTKDKFKTVTSHAIVRILLENGLWKQRREIIFTSPPEEVETIGDVPYSFADNPEPEIETVTLYGYWTTPRKAKVIQKTKTKEIAVTTHV